MRPTAQLHQLGQSLWLDNITRSLLTSGTLKRYIDELSITGLTSNPTIFDHAISHGSDYDVAIREKRAAGYSDEELFFDIALEDITTAEATLLDFADHGAITDLLCADGGDAEAILARFAQAGINIGSLATQLQEQGANAFVRSWDDLLDRIAAKSHQLAAAR